LGTAERCIAKPVRGAAALGSRARDRDARPTTRLETPPAPACKLACEAAGTEITGILEGVYRG